jgi:hypothetical protein
MTQVDMICLANSRKHGGRCVAGIRAGTGEWVRPVSDSPDGTLFWTDCRLQDGSVPAPLDLVRLPILRRRPEPHQPENWLLGKRPWELLARPAPNRSLAELEQRVLTEPELLGNQVDRVAYSLLCARPAVASLALVRPDELSWQITRSYSGRRQARACFMHRSIRYNLVVTDPNWENRLAGLDFGNYSSAEVGTRKPHRFLLTISLGEPLGDYCYKLVAAVLELT